MKNIYLTFVILFSTAITFAQTFSLSPKIAKESGSGSGSADLFCNINNNTTVSTDTMFSWTILKYSPPSAWTISFCDPNNCYGLINVGLNHSFYIGKGKMGQMHSTYIFNNTGGWDTCKILITNLATSATDTAIFIVNSWYTGVSEVLNPADFGFYPNPAKDVLTIKNPGNSIYTIDIYNILGVKVKSIKSESINTKINTSDLKNGAYLVQISDGKNSFSKRIFKSE